MAFALTEEQSRAVHDRGRTAGVGCGRLGQDRVLVERLLDQVTGEGADIDDFLVITYTRAAAAELRARIAQELSDRLAAAQRPAPAAADHVGLQGPDLHGARLLCRSAAGERPPDRVGPGLSAVRRGGRARS